jgi:hypothetical protein
MTSTRRFRFTSHSAITKHAVPPPADGKAKDALFFDDRGDPPGFGIRVGREKSDGSPPTRTWILQLDVHGKTRRWSLGRFPTLGLEAAREVARHHYITVKAGEDPAAAQRARDAQAVTLGKAVEHHIARMLTRGDQPRSIEDMRGDAERYFGRTKWGEPTRLDRELRSISRLDCLELSRALPEAALEGRAREVRGQPRAPHAPRRLQHRDAHLRQPALQPRRRGRVQPRGAQARADQVRGDARVLGRRERASEPRAPRPREVLALTGPALDRRALDSAWEEVNLSEEPMAFGDVLIPPGCIHRPSPKGGTKKNFTIPLPEAVLAILRRRLDDNPQASRSRARGCFPTIGRDGKVTHIHNAAEDTLKPFGYSPHRLRDSWITALDRVRRPDDPHEGALPTTRSRRAAT